MDWSFMGGYGQDGQFQMNPQFLQMLAQTGAGLGKGQSVGQALGESTAQALRMKALMGQNQQLTPTPIGQPGPDSVTTKQTADGTTTTIQTPSQRNLQTYGTSVPPEAQTSQMGGVSDQSPFFKQLLGIMS